MAFLIFCLFIVTGICDNCLILSFQSAGTRGVYEIGALKAFFDLLNPKDIDYDIFEGLLEKVYQQDLFLRLPLQCFLKEMRKMPLIMGKKYG